MRVSNSLLLGRYLSDLTRAQWNLATLTRQSSTGKAIERPSDNPTTASTSLDLHAALAHLKQYNRNIDDGSSRLSYTETTISEVDSQLQRVRELTVQASNSYLTRSDRTAIAQEVDQLLEHVITISNSNYRGRYIYSGYETLTRAFTSNSNTTDGMTNSVSYRGDTGRIDRNIGIGRDLGVNFSGKDIYLKQTYELLGKQLSPDPLGFNGVVEINDRLFVISPTMTLDQIRDAINSDPEAEVQATVEPGHRLQLASLNSSQPIKVRDIAGSVLSDLGILPEGAFNLAQTTPGVLPLVDSRGAIHDNSATPLAFPLTLTPATQNLVVTLSGAANGGFTQTEVLKLDAVTYNNSAELAAEIQKRADLAFGPDKLLVNDVGGGVLEIETYIQSSAVSVNDLVLGGAAPDGTVDTASTALGFNNLGAAPWQADFAGLDGNDRFTIDLGLSAYRTSSSDETPLDLPVIELNLDGGAAGPATVQDIVDNINDKILKNRYLSGLVEAVNDSGRIRIQTTKKDGSITAADLLLANAVGGPPVPATDTLGNLGFYVDPATGVSSPPVPAMVVGTGAYPPGIAAIAAGVNDQFSIDLGPGSSIDGTDPAAVTLTLTPGAYATALSLANEINAQISLSPVLKNAVIAQVRTVLGVDYVDLVTANSGSRVQSGDLILTDIIPGTLANLGLGAPATPGGGSAAGQGDITLPQNMIDTMLQIRDELLGYAARDSRLLDLLDADGSGLGLFPGFTVRINSDGSSSQFRVQRFTTLQELADQVEAKLGFQLEVSVLRDGTLRLFNPSTQVINDISLEALDDNGNHIAAFEKAFSGLSGDLQYRGELRSTSVYEDESFNHMTDRIGDVDDALETVLATLAVIGSRSKRMEMTQTQNDSVEVNLLEIQSSNDNVDMAETIIRLQEQQNVLQAALGAGAKIIPVNLFDFLN
jgi:flagellin-like hook-associated protein FlgL